MCETPTPISRTTTTGPATRCAHALRRALAHLLAGRRPWPSREHGHPPGTGTARPAGEGGPAAVRHALGGTTLWRLRATVRDTPGSLARLCAALAGLDVDILTLQTHPLSEGTVDEFLLRAPGSTEAGTIGRAVGTAGGRDVWLERADAHDLVDTPTRVLALAAGTAADPAGLPLALRQLLGRCTIRSLPAGRCQEPPVDGELTGNALRLRDPSGGTLVIERPHPPFTPTEFARARALVELDGRLGARPPRRREVLTLPDGDEITVRQAGPGDLAAARALHDRCSAGTLRARYHGQVADADRYLDHLLSPRHGRTLAVETTSGRLVALGHLLWDGDESEVALLVQDDWQHRGIGTRLLRHLVALAGEADRTSVYAVTTTANTAMVAAMRGLRLPLDHQVEEGTMVITAVLGDDAAGPRATAPRTAVREG